MGDRPRPIFFTGVPLAGGLVWTHPALSHFFSPRMTASYTLFSWRRAWLVDQPIGTVPSLCLPHAASSMTTLLSPLLTHMALSSLGPSLYIPTGYIPRGRGARKSSGITGATKACSMYFLCLLCHMAPGTKIWEASGRVVAWIYLVYHPLLRLGKSSAGSRLCGQEATSLVCPA